VWVTLAVPFAVSVIFIDLVAQLKVAVVNRHHGPPEKLYN
jgi:hypothetical protein